MKRIARRRFLIAAGALAAGRAAAQRQQPPKVHRIGILVGIGSKNGWWAEDWLGGEMRKLGYEEGRNCAVEFRTANRVRGMLPALAAELVAARVDIILADLPPAILAAKGATSTIPIVMIYGMVPQELGLIASLARPGSNVTGTLLQGPEWAGRYCQFMKEVLPRQAKVAMLWDTGFPGLEPYFAHLTQAARELDLRPEVWPIGSEKDIDAALVRMTAERLDALTFAPTGPINPKVGRLLEVALAQRIAPFCTTMWPVEEGALLAYEADTNAIMARAAAIADKVLKGTSPAGIPVEEPTKYRLWINLKTARTVGLTIPKLVQLQADRLFE